MIEIIHKLINKQNNRFEEKKKTLGLGKKICTFSQFHLILILLTLAFISRSIDIIKNAIYWYI